MLIVEDQSTFQIKYDKKEGAVRCWAAPFACFGEILKSQIFINQNHMQSAGLLGITGNQELAADGVRNDTIHTSAGLTAGSL